MATATTRARIATALLALGLVAATWFAGDGGGARAAVGQATGPLVATAPGDSAILVARGLAPGATRSGEVTVTNAGDSPGTFVLGTRDLVDSIAPLSRVLDVAVDEVTQGRPAARVYSGRLDALTGVALGRLEQGDSRRYRLTVSFPAGRADVDDAYQGASTSVTFVWAATGATTAAQAAPTAAAAPPSAAQDTRTPANSVSATAVGSGRARGATLSARGRQTGAGDAVVAWVTCRARCRLEVGGSASVGSTRVSLRPVHRTLPASARVRVRLALPRAARAALVAGRPVTVRLHLTATVGGRAVVRRTVQVVVAAR
jgi:hypothetical protein